jgi:hypothetical protein
LAISPTQASEKGGKEKNYYRTTIVFELYLEQVAGMEQLQNTVKQNTADRKLFRFAVRVSAAVLE